MTDSLNHRVLNGEAQNEKLDAIARGASRFRFERELSSAHDLDVGIPRFQPSLEIIDNVTMNEIEANPVEAIIQTSRRLSSRYGNDVVISATTKLLWMKFRYPIVIFDGYTETALGTKRIREYFDQWNARYVHYEQSVIEACDILSDSLQFTCDPKVATTEFVVELASADWFRRRVFGTYLYNIGRYAV